MDDIVIRLSMVVVESETVDVLDADVGPVSEAHYLISRR